MNIFLKPGEVYVSKKPAVVSTILGSCVAVTLFNARMRVGSICHALLPKGRAGENGNLDYVDNAVHYMIRRLLAFGIGREEMEVKLLGGADVIECQESSKVTVGQLNIQSALEVIEKEGIRLAVSHVGGKKGRRVRFYTDTGSVLLKPISRIP